jgi:Tol biopolymer transport system component
VVNRRAGRPALVLVAGLLIAAASLVAPPAVAISPGTTEAVSVGAAGNESAGPASSPAISADGEQVAFESTAAFDPVVRPGSPYNVFVRDRRKPGHTVLISRGLPITTFASRGNAAPLRATAAVEEGGNDDSLHPTISATGRYVAFETSASNLRDGFGRSVRRIVVCDRDPDNDGVFDELRPDGLMDFAYVYLGDPYVAGGTDPSLSAAGTAIAWRQQVSETATTRIAVAQLVLDPQGHPLPPDPEALRYPEAEGVVGPPQLSADGKQVVFVAGGCAALVSCPDPAGSLQGYDIAADRTTRVDYLPGGGFSGTAKHPAISRTGRFIAYEHLLPPAGPVVTVMVDRESAGVPSASIASRDLAGQPAEGMAPALSADGRYLAFESSSDGMHADAQGIGRTAIVLRDPVLDTSREKAGLPRLAGELGSPAAVSCSGEICPAVGPSESPRLSADGSVLVFTSAGDDLLAPPCCTGAVFARVFQPRVADQTAVFGTTQVGTTLTRTITLQYSGFGPLTIGAIQVRGDSEFVAGAAENCVGATLHASDMCQVAVAFTPTSAGLKQSVLRIEQGDGTVTELPLRGEGDLGPADPSTPPDSPAPPGTLSGGLVVTPDPLDFGGARPAFVPIGARTVEVRNQATVPITIASADILTGPRFIAGDFTVVETTCTARTLAPGDTCTVELQATPQAPGPRSGVLTITPTDPAYARLVALGSRAAEPTLVVNPAVVRTNRVTQISGQNFPSRRSVTITVTTPGSRLRTTTVTGPDGRFTAPVVVFPQTSAGTWPVVASVDGTTIRAKGTVLVVPGSYQPPDFTSRR